MALWFFKMDANSLENSQLLTERHISLITIKFLKADAAPSAKRVMYFLEASAKMEFLILVACNHGLVKEVWKNLALLKKIKLSPNIMLEKAFWNAFYHASWHHFSVSIFSCSLLHLWSFESQSLQQAPIPLPVCGWACLLLWLWAISSTRSSTHWASWRTNLQEFRIWSRDLL